MGTLEFKRIMRDVKEQEFDCGVESINNMSLLDLKKC